VEKKENLMRYCVGQEKMTRRVAKKEWAREAKRVVFQSKTGGTYDVAKEYGH